MKRGQFWYGDFLVAVLILMIIGFLFVNSIRDITTRNEIIKELILDASDISSTLMSEGYGSQNNWLNNEGTVGFVKDYRFNTTRLEHFATFNLNLKKSLLGTFNNVWIYLQERDGEIILSSDIAYHSIDDIDADNLVSIKRFIFCSQGICEGDMYTLGVVVWP
tara:strand:+ start:550 stop:1038 length:489 start_codon:yes stop_codon:yes gene_type:complete